MPSFYLKPVFWNTADYQRPSGVQANSGYPKERGYGHEEWNNSPKMLYEESGILHRAFHIEGIGTLPPDEDGPIVIFLYASHDGKQELVGAAAGAKFLSDSDLKRIALTEKLNIRDFWKDAWALDIVRQTYSNDKQHFMRDWESDFSWIPNWTCLSSMFFQPEKAVVLDPFYIRGTSKLLTMFGRHTPIDAAAALRVLTSVPHSSRTEEWRRIAAVVANTGGLSSAALDDVRDIQSSPELDITVKKALIDARRGQGKFRKQVATRWGRACAVNGCAQQEVLRASHIKPWWASTNEERLNPANGLLLTANLDALFDRGLLTFDDLGKMLISEIVTNKDRRLLGLPNPLRAQPKAEEQVFLKYHRNEVFRH